MCETLHRLYDDWETSPDVHAIILKGAGGKAFCAGGDVKGMVQLILKGDVDRAIRLASQPLQEADRLPRALPGWKQCRVQAP